VNGVPIGAAGTRQSALTARRLAALSARAASSATCQRLHRRDLPAGHQHDLEIQTASQFHQTPEPQVSPATLEARNLRLGEPDSLAQSTLADGPGLAYFPEVDSDLLDCGVHDMACVI